LVATFALHVLYTRIQVRFTRRALPGAAAALLLPSLAAQTRRLKVVVTGGHPGDPEYGCGGTVARYTAAGNDVVLLYLNRGQKTCPDPDPEANPRVAEARKACEILHARAVFAPQCDAHAIVDRPHYDEFRDLLAAEKPDVVFTHWPIDNHADHRAMANLAYDAWIKQGRGFLLYFYEVSDGEDTQMFRPTAYVDITTVESVKRAACYAHASQSPDRYYALQTDIAKFRGLESGYKLAEAFARHPRSHGADLLP
jgi:LmbE family N-acetylglucosaminyl deacetylase